MNRDYHHGYRIGHQDVCYDNKAMMVTTAPSEQLGTQTVVNVTESSKPTINQQSTISRLRYKIRRKHFIDIFIALFVSTLIALVEYGIVPNTELGFLCKDPTISYPYKGDTINVPTLLISSIFGSLCMIILVEFLREKCIKNIRIGNVWKYYQECLVGIILTLLITDVIKVIVGEQRPHFFDSCEPDTNKNCVFGTFITEYKCMNTALSQYRKTDITRSFPSGHTSVSMFVGLYLSYVIHKRVPIASVTIFSKPFLISICLSWALICSLTRITDRRHHWWDVLAGAVIGFCSVLYTISIVDFNDKPKTNELKRTDTTTTVLLDIKNKDATSVII